MNKIYCPTCKRDTVVNVMTTAENIALFCSECGKFLGTKVPLLSETKPTVVNIKKN